MLVGCSKTSSPDSTAGVPTVEVTAAEPEAPAPVEPLVENETAAAAAPEPNPEPAPVSVPSEAASAVADSAPPTEPAAVANDNSQTLFTDPNAPSGYEIQPLTAPEAPAVAAAPPAAADPLAALAESGDADAQYQMALANDANPEESSKWYLRAAEQGNVEAQMTMAVRYSLGQGVEKNLDEAARWLALAEEQDQQNVTIIRSSRQVQVKPRPSMVALNSTQPNLDTAYDPNAPNTNGLPNPSWAPFTNFPGQPPIVAFNPPPMDPRLAPQPLPTRQPLPYLPAPPVVRQRIPANGAELRTFQPPINSHLVPIAAEFRSNR